MTPSSEKKCLVILGMHRSGTSALSGALHLAGFNPGNELFEPEEDNPKGNFENARITMLNERILDDLYAKWNDTLLIPEDWWNSGLFDTFLDTIIQILEEEFNTGAPVLIKDPRLSILLPLYQKAFEKLHVHPGYVICTRNPLEIIASLVRRNNLSKEKSLLLWMDHQLKAELYSRNFKRIFLSYHEFLTSPIHCLTSIKTSVADEIQLTPDAQKKILEFLDKGLKHHNLQGKAPEIQASPELVELYKTLDNTNLRDLENDEIKALDRLRLQFYDMFRFYNGLADPFQALLLCTVPYGKPVILKSPVRFGENNLIFSLNETVPVNKLVFKPSNSRVGLKILQVQIKGQKGGMVNLDEMNTNAGYQAQDGTLVFETEMPEIVFTFENPLEITEVRIDLLYLTFGRTAYRMGVRYKKQELMEIQSKLNSVEENNKQELMEIQSQLKSAEEQRLIINNQLHSLTGELAQLQKKIIEAERDIRNKEAELLRKEENIDQKKEELVAKNAEIYFKSQKIQILESEKVTKEKELTEANRVIQEWSREVESLQARVRSLESSIQIILDSLTWKWGRFITYPIRKAYDLVKPWTKGK